MKIHIDTADEKEKAQAKTIATKGNATKSSAKQKPGTPMNTKPAQQSQPSQQPLPKQKANLPKSPPKEPKAPKDVVAARKAQTDVLQARQQRELQGKTDAFKEQAGVGFWPTMFL
jgi:hypothetical protein